MNEKILFNVETPYRQPISVKGWFFGNPEKKTLAVIGALRGTEVQQMYICSQLIRNLANLEQAGCLAADCGILVIPCANQFSMNVKRRFWAVDNTDINRMFPGYDKGETTQRIAASIFSALQGYEYGIQITGTHMPGAYVPHIRIIETGYEHPQTAAAFGLPYIVMRQPRPYDTTTLNYNWQIWNTTAFSIYANDYNGINQSAAREITDAVIRFLSAKNFCHTAAAPGAKTRQLREEMLHDIIAVKGGIITHQLKLNDKITAGALLAKIIDPCTGQILEQLHSNINGRVFFIHQEGLINGHNIALRLLPE